jgi:hypothetical protein
MTDMAFIIFVQGIFTELGMLESDEDTQEHVMRFPPLS